MLVEADGLLCVQRRWNVQPGEMLLARKASHDGRTGQDAS